MPPPDDQLWMPDRRSSALRVHFLGTVSLEAIWILQRQIAEELSARNDRFGVLILCEHLPAVTIGREGTLENLRVSAREFAARQMPVHQVARGGGTWVHAPGQMAIYPILPISRLGLTPVKFTSTLEESVISTAADLGVAARSSQGAASAGVVGRNGQFAFLGASIVQGVSQFGLVFNVRPATSLFSLVNWHAEGNRVTGLESMRQRPTSLAAVRSRFLSHAAANFGYSEYHVATGHPWLRRTTISQRFVNSQQELITGDQAGFTD